MYQIPSYNTSMARPNLQNQKRLELIPIVAKAFCELGYRKATTAELSRRCKVQENILYRLWKDKKAMFAASIDYVFEATMADWKSIIEKTDDEGALAERLLAHDSKNRGKSGFYRITFTALAETDDPDVRQALANMYKKFETFVVQLVIDHRKARGRENANPPPELTAWALLGVATMADIGRTTNLLTAKERSTMFSSAGKTLLDGQ